MEDLGNININIRDSSGGGAGGGGGRGGGGGQAGGGPSVPPRLVPPIPPTPSTTPPTPPTTGQMSLVNMAPMLDRLAKGMNIKDELMGFFRSPSVGGFQALMSTASETGTMLAGFSGALGAAVPIIGAAIAGIGIAVVALKAMSAAAEMIQARIREVMRFSGELAIAAARENLAQFSRQLREATENGHAYAAVQRQATAAADAANDVSIEWNRFLTMFAATWHNLVWIASKLALPFVKLLGLLGDAGVFVGELTESIGNTVWNGTKVAVEGLADSIINGLSMVFGFRDMWLWIKDAIASVLRWLGVIAKNTQPPSGNNLNAWFMNDVQAITGRRY